MPIEWILLVIILLAGFYMAWNIGANDVANAIGTSVGSGALTLRHAVVLAAILEFCGAFFFGSHVSDTIQSGIVDQEIFANNPLILVYGMLSSLLAAGLWLQMASYFGWPVSTTHSIVGAIVGFGLVVGGWEAVYWDNVMFIISSWIVSPLMGGIISYLFFTILRKKIFYTLHPIESAKKITPIIVFVFLTMLSLVVCQGLRYLELTNLQATGISLLIGAISSFISYLFIKKITSPARSRTHVIYSPELYISLDKAKKHLEKARATCLGDAQYQAGLLAEEVDLLSQSLKSHEDTEVSKSEYRVVENIFGYLQIMSACMMAFAHGANDVANAIGPLSASVNILLTHHVSTSTTVPLWALALGGFGIVIGLATWGWRVIETIGKKITELTPTRGFAAEFGAATTVVIASRLGLPISTTHTLVGAVVGVGLARGIEALDLNMTRDIVISWLVTVPAGAGIAVAFFYLIQSIFG